MKDLYIALAILGVITVISLRHMFRAHHPLSIIHRWFTGHHLRGQHMTDAGWFSKGTKKLIPLPVHRWWYLPRIQRAGIRTGATVLAVILAYGFWKAREITILVLAAGGGISLIITAIYSIRRGRSWFNNRVTVTPLGEALAPILGIPVVQAQQAITLPPSHLTQREGEIGGVVLPRAFRASPGEREAVEHLISSRTAVDVDFDWRTAKNPGRLVILASPKPPDRISFAALADEMSKCGPQEVVLGLDRRRQVFRGSFALDDPHWGFSVGSGRGKSTMLLSTGAQILHKDPRNTLDGIDPKMNSLTPLIGIPGVTIARDPMNIPEMWDLLGRFYREMMADQAALKDDPTLEFPFHLFVIDEINTFAAMSKTYWQGVRTGSQPAVPPVWANVIAPCLWMGRSVNRHLVVVGQRLDDRATGNIGLRDSLGFRGVAGFRANQYRMLIGDGAIPRSQKQKGRWLYSDGQDETWCQNVLGTPEEIRDYARHGRTLSLTVESQPEIPAPRRAESESETRAES